MKVCIDPGHGDIDNGATGNGIVEKRKNMEVALAVCKLLVGAGHAVVMTRTSDTAFAPGVNRGAKPITTRGCYAVKQCADIFVSVHHDAGGNPNFRGCSGFYWTGCSNAKDLAASITTRIHERLGIPYAYGYPAQVHWVKLGVLRGCDNWKYVTACLVECATLTGTKDAAIIKAADYVGRIAQCIADGIVAHAAKEGLVTAPPTQDAANVKVVGPNNKVIACEVGLAGKSVTVNAALLLEALGVPLTAVAPGVVHANGRAYLDDIAAGLPAQFTFHDKMMTQGRRIYIKVVTP